MKKTFKLLITSLALSLFFASPSEARWAIDTSLMIDEPAPYETIPQDFVISSDEIVETPESGKLYAIVEDGIVTSIVEWSSEMTKTTVVSLPGTLSVNYIDINGFVRSEPINHGDKIFVKVSETQTVSLDYDYTAAPVFALPEVIGIPVALESTIVSSKGKANDNTTSITLSPVVNTDPNKTVEVQVITNGMSYTSITTDNSTTPVTINNLPQNSYVTVQTVIRDTVSGETQLIQSTATKTEKIDTPVVENARDAAKDKAEVSKPVVSSVTDASSGSLTATVAFDSISGFDSTKTSASVVLVSKSGSVTSIGVDGSGGSVNIKELSSSEEYVVKLVIRDLATGQETIISGDNLKKSNG